MEKALNPFYRYWFQGSKEVKQCEQGEANTQCGHTHYVFKKDNTQYPASNPISSSNKSVLHVKKKKIISPSNIL